MSRDRIRTAVGVLCLLLGALALFGWFAGVSWLVQLDPALVAVQPNSALCFVLLGLALVTVGRAPLGSAAIASAVATIATLTLLQYLLAADFGIDRALVRPFTETQTTHPGRMAPVTAISHLLVAVALVLEGTNSRRAGSWQPLIGLTTVILAVHALISPMWGDPRVLGWGELARTSPQSAVVLAIVGAWLVARHRATLVGPPSLGVPLAAMVLGTLLSATAWEVLLDQRGNWMRAVVGRTAETTREVVEDELQARLLGLRVLAGHWVPGEPPPIAQWMRDADRFARQFPAFMAWYWVTPEGVLGWEHVQKGSPDALRDALFRYGLPSATRTAYALDGLGLVVIATPIELDGRDMGHIAAVLDGGALLEGVVPRETIESYAVTLFAGRDLVGREAQTLEEAHRMTEQFQLGGTRWELWVGPERAWIDMLRTSLPEVFLTLGIGLALAFAHGLHIGRETALRSRELAASNEALRREIEGHAAAREALRRSHDELEQRVLERTEALRRANEELARSNRELDHFASVASHDLKEPLQTVSLYLQLLERRFADQLDPASKKWISTASSALSRMSHMIGELLAYARVESAPRSVPLDPRPVVDEVVAALQAPVQAVGAEIVVDEELPDVMAEPGLLGQVFQNLLANALKFRSDEPPRVEIHARRTDDEVRFEVRDNGIGIDPGRVEEVFEMFGRLHGAGVAGAGIGLALSKRIVEKLGGRIGAEPAPDRGSIFWFTLPPAAA